MIRVFTTALLGDKKIISNFRGALFSGCKNYWIFDSYDFRMYFIFKPEVAFRYVVSRIGFLLPMRVFFYILVFGLDCRTLVFFKVLL